MIGPSRPLIVLFGSSIVQLSYFRNGWGATLATCYARKADIFLRGYIGWNSRMALEIYKKVFPKEHCWDKHKEIQPSLVILYFGGNDSQDSDFPNSSNVPLDEYVENMRKIALHIKGLSEKTHLIMLSAPAVNEELILKFYGDNRGRSNEVGRKYAEAGVKLGQELGVPVVNFFEALYEKPGVFWDGMHLTAEGSKILFEKIQKVIKEADWEPTLDWDKMPTEYADIGTDMHLEKLMKETTHIGTDMQLEKLMKDTEDETIGITDNIGTDMQLEKLMKDTEDETIGITDSDSQEPKPHEIILDA